MEIIFLNLNEMITKNDSLSITIGAYDGLHKGHQAVLNTLIKDKKNDKTAVFTFDTHPDYLLKKTQSHGVVNSFNEKCEFFSALKIDYLYVLPQEVLKKSAEEFNNILKKINVRRIVVGNDFVYGKNKLGNIDSLKKDFIVDVIEDIKYQNQRVSSTKIRTYLSNGYIKELEEIMLLKFEIIGKVIEGSHIGEELGFKTANIDVDEKYQVLKNGVYKVDVIIDENVYQGVANYGINPTCNLLDKPRLEVHILNFDKDIYHRTIKVIFVDFIRSEIKFNSKEELIKQIESDIKYVKESL